MKNTTFRKKALLSSVAMLLVALVALGSATFAWFTTNPQVSADGLTLKATASAGLQILSESEKDLGKDYGISTVLNASVIGTTDPDGVTLGVPVSLDCSVEGAVFRTTSAAVETNYAKDTNADITTSSAVYQEIIYLRSSVNSEEKITVNACNVTIEEATGTTAASNKNLYQAIRVTLVDGSTVIGTWSPDGVANKYLTETAVSTTDYTNAYDNGDIATISKQVGYATPGTVTMYVWLDGEDTLCSTSNVDNLKDLVKNISVKFSTAGTITA
ncbi:MAG: hypothetical protein IJO20_04305 [Ruminococcus sp.]|nr:hypothetical protein [Ruminococcus sp.]